MIRTQATPMNYINGKGHKSELKSNGSYLINHTKSKSCHQLYMASEAYTHTSRQGRIQDSKKGEHNYVTVSMEIVYEVHNLACKACQI